MTRQEVAWDEIGQDKSAWESKSFAMSYGCDNSLPICVRVAMTKLPRFRKVFFCLEGINIFVSG